MKLLLINVMAIVGVSCIINLSSFDFEPVVVFIEATCEKRNMQKIYKDLQVQLSFRELQDVTSFDTTGNRIILVFWIYNDVLSKRCEELLRAMVQNRDYSRIDYGIVY